MIQYSEHKQKLLINFQQKLLKPEFNIKFEFNLSQICDKVIRFQFFFYVISLILVINFIDILYRYTLSRLNDRKY